MKRIGFFALGLILFLGLTISGCSSAQKKLSEEVKGVKARVDTLETRVETVETKQSEAERLAMEQAKETEEMKTRSGGKTNFEIKQKRSPKEKGHIKEIQACLKNAGFYKGEIDGVKGRKTRAAIRKFQSANGLNADGVVGKRTWEALSKYSSETAAPAASAVEEEATANTK